MRIKRIHLAGLVAVLAGAAAEEAKANDVTVSTATTTPLSTSSPDGVSAGDVTITSAGSITVTTGAAVTVDSNNDVSNAGTLASSDAPGTTGILIQGGGFTGSVVNTGSINLTETYVITDADNDGDLDGEYAVGAGRRGIWLQSGAGFTGNIDNQNQINIEGNDSAGMQLDSLLTGDLLHTGAINIIGDNTRGVLVNEGVDGDVLLRGNISARGEGASAIEINGPISGELNLRGTIVSTGFHSTTRPGLQTVIDALDADDLMLGSATVALHGSVAGGVTLQGVGVEDDVDDDGDGETEAEGDTDDDLGVVITSYGSAPALWISPEAGAPANITLGANADGFGLQNRGAVNASGVYDNINATGVRIEGAGGATVTVNGGMANDGAVTVTAFDADAHGIVVGAGAILPSLLNRSSITASVSSDAADTAYGVLFEAGANVGAVNNTGVINVVGVGEETNAAVFTDRSGTVTQVTNSGSLVAQLVAPDLDPDDDVTPVPNGDAVAIDLSANTSGALVRQIPDSAFNDDDDVDNDSAGRPPVLIRGDILLGSGADTVEILAGNVFGDISFGAGADTLLINGATVIGGLSDSDGALVIDVASGRLGHTGGVTNLTSAQFGADSELSVLVSDEPGESTFFNASGAVTFEAGAVITPVIPAGLPESGSTVFLTAGTLNGADNVVREITNADGAPYLYNLAITSATTNTAGDSLAASYLLKTPGQLGLDGNQTNAYMPIIEAMRQDDTASSALASITDEAGFFDAYQQLLPDYSSAAAEIAATAIKEAQAASSNRLARVRLSEVTQSSAWVQEIAYGVSRDDKFGLGYRGSGFGLAAGIDGPLNNGALFGVSGAFIASDVEQPLRRDGEVSAWFGQANAYLGAGLGPINLDFVAGLGAGKMKSARVVDIGESFSAEADAEWWAYEGHAAAHASMPLRMGSRLVVTPRLGLTYLHMQEDEYVEEGGGAAIDLDVDGATTQRLWGEAGLDFSWRFGNDASSFQPRIFVGHRLNIIKDPAERTLRFASGGADFTLTDTKPGDGGPVAGLGFDATNGWSTFSLMYEGEFGDQVERHSLNAGVRFRF